MTFRFIPDIFGQYYIGIDVKPHQADCKGLTLAELIKRAGWEIPGFGEYNDKLLTRNMGSYHITVFSVMEYGSHKISDDIIGWEHFDVEFTGIGSATKDGKTTYFVTVNSPGINKVRQDHGFGPRDLHITIGYTHKDIFGMPKSFPNVFEAKSIKS